MSHSNYTEPTEEPGERTLGKPVSKDTQRFYETPELTRRMITRDIHAGAFFQGLGCVLQGVGIGVVTYALTKDANVAILTGSAFGGGAGFRDVGSHIQNEALHKETRYHLRKR
jgi:hypothetical protein